MQEHRERKICENIGKGDMREHREREVCENLGKEDTRTYKAWKEKYPNLRK